MRTLIAISVAALAVCVSDANASTALTTSKARSAIKSAAEDDGYMNVAVGKCRRKSERKVVCAVLVKQPGGATSRISYMAYRDSKGHLAVKRVRSSGGNQNGPGAPLT
jgi:hypothetical protein